MAGSGAQVRAGRVRAIAVAGEARATMLPDVPTFLETGFSDRFALDDFGRLFAPARTPPDVLARIEAAFRTVATAPAMMGRLAEIETVPAFLDSRDFAALLERLLRDWTAITTDLDLRIDS
jgi:tripartite-type tricarboxylate transporter receptor subunit TctC